MATPLAWLLNLDADEELARPAGYRSPAHMAARAQALSAKMSLLLQPQDVLLDHAGPHARRASAPAPQRALAFCPTPSALARIAALGFAPPAAPPLAVLQRANHRAFCAELGQPLEGARYARNMDELLATLCGASRSEDFVLKRPFGFAGRERRLALRGELDAPTLGFARRTFARGQGLQVEPWLARAGDFAQHGFLLRTGALLTGPLVVQHCDRMGRWQRSELAAPDALPSAFQQALERELTRAGEALAALGYFGPFGIDAFAYRRPDDTLGFQPRSEINARFTMGYPRSLLERALAADAQAGI